MCAMQETKEIYDRLREILGGQESVKLYLEFLKRNDKTDTLILKHSKVLALLYSSSSQPTHLPGL